MTVYMILLLAVGLSMDAFAVSITNGLCYKMPLFKNALYSGLAFGLFQGLMPLIGYFAGSTFSEFVTAYDHWIALILLSIIGAKMIIEAVKELRNPEITPIETTFTFKMLALQAVATSIDALAVGVGLAAINVNIYTAVLMIGITTFCFSFIGVIVGKMAGSALKEKAEIIGGAILVLIGLKIFIEHVFLA